MKLVILAMLVSILTSCYEKDGEDTSAEIPVVRLTCEETSYIVEAPPGELLVAVAVLESEYPELGPCCDPWETTWSARVSGDETLYFSEVELVVDETTTRLKAVFPGEVDSCELLIWVPESP